MTRYHKKVILFPAGASGHFLCSFLTTGKVLVESQYRIDFGQIISGAIFVSNDLEKIKHTILNDSRKTILTKNCSITSGFYRTYFLPIHTKMIN